MIILNEHEWADEMINTRSLGKKPFETLSRVAKYYIDKDYSKREVRDLLDTFLIQCDPAASLPKWSDTLDAALCRALKYDAVNIQYIPITDTELHAIESVNGRQAQRLAFTLLCLAKYWNHINPLSDYWVNNKDSDIMRMANINTSIKRQSLLYFNLNEAGMIQFSKKIDNTNVRVKFAKQGDTVLKISDFRNLGYQYLKYLGEPYFECENCGITTKFADPVKGKKQKYCKDCAVEIRTKQNVNSVMRSRCKLKS